MKHLIKLTDFTKDGVKKIFHIADEIQTGKYQNFLKGKTIVMFFTETSIRTRVTFEKGIYLLGGQSILFPTSSLDKKEDIKDVVGYLNNWADGLVIRHKDISLLEKMAEVAKMPIINALTDVNHPCEMLADMYALSKIRDDFTKDKYLFVGASGNIGLAWKETSELMGFELEQCCPKGYEIPGAKVCYSLDEAMKGKDIICTDSLCEKWLADFSDYQVTEKKMQFANDNAILNPCPPFFTGEEVSENAIKSKYFVGYDFKKCLLEIQQAIIIYCMSQ